MFILRFLFEGSEGTALYTGDFRLPKGSGPRMKFLHSGTVLFLVQIYNSMLCILSISLLVFLFGISLRVSI